MEKVKCGYCKKLITTIKLKRHQNTIACRNKQQNIDVILPLQEYKCKYCEKSFNRLDKKKEHEDNKSCNASDIIIKLEVAKETINKLEVAKETINKLEETSKEIIKKHEIEIEYLKSQIQVYKPTITNIGTNVGNTNITINNNINLNFSEIRNHLDKFNIFTLADNTALINFLMPIFSNKIKLTNECKQIISYYIDDKMINEIKCKAFLCNSAGELVDISDKICHEELNKNILNDTIIKNACKNNTLLNSISTEKGMINGIRKKTPLLLVHEVVKYLKDNNITDIKGV